MFENALRHAFHNVTFEPGELAFLAATSKVEVPIRDRLSWQLQKILEDYDVVREWRRADIAILLDEKPVGIIELKAMYTWDATEENYDQYVTAIEKDEEKALNLVGSETPIFTILLAANPKPSDPKRLRSYIKYAPGIMKSLRNKTHDEIAKLSDQIVQRAFLKNAPRKLVFHETIQSSGQSFDVEFDVLAWCFRYSP